MTVAELIAELRELSPDSEVVRRTGDHAFIQISSAHYELAEKLKGSLFEWFEGYPVKGHLVKIVVLEDY